MSAAPDFAFTHYGDGEWMMRIGAVDGAPVLLLPPLFEEMNRLRALMMDVMRGLADRGHGCWLPDLPGTGESARALDAITWADWRSAVRLAAADVQEAGGAPPVVASFRGAALLDDAALALAWWRFAPLDGSAVVRDLDRAGLSGGAPWAGYDGEAKLRPCLLASRPQPVVPSRIVRLQSDPAAADVRLAGPVLWRRSEPDRSPELSSAIIEDISAFAMSCAG